MSALAPEFAKLSVAERIQLAEDLWDSIAQDAPEALSLDQAKLAEIERRLREHDADPSTAVAWEQLRTELFKGKP
ncbi:addiction module protein [Nevskia soli]|uniref:addiction module protein n=1 Tax=Nevskia soli TaxID=418856 RepID=UPI0004A7262A|nr:addiction module protein [Nevskia soli]